MAGRERQAGHATAAAVGSVEAGDEGLEYLPRHGLGGDRLRRQRVESAGCGGDRVDQLAAAAGALRISRGR